VAILFVANCNTKCSAPTKVHQASHNNLKRRDRQMKLTIAGGRRVVVALREI